MKSNISIPEINGPHQLAQSLHASQLQIRHHQLAINPSSHLPAPVPPTSPRSHLVKYEIPNASKPDKSRWVPGSLGTQLRSASLAKLLKESPAICPLSALNQRYAVQMQWSNVSGKKPTCCKSKRSKASCTPEVWKNGKSLSTRLSESVYPCWIGAETPFPTSVTLQFVVAFSKASNCCFNMYQQG